jgi:hypothetical protein
MGNFHLLNTIPAGGGASGITAGDFDQDGVVDLAVAATAIDCLTILYGKGGATFTAPQIWHVGPNPIAVTQGSIYKRGGHTDLIVSLFGYDVIALVEGLDARVFAMPLYYRVGEAPRATLVRDVNGDTEPDFLVAVAKGDGLGVMLARDDDFAPVTSTKTGTFADAIVTSDFDGDGKTDVAVANGVDDTVSILLGNGDGSFAKPLTFRVGAFPIGLAVADFDGDGRPDLASADFGGGAVSIMLNRLPTP